MSSFLFIKNFCVFACLVDYLAKIRHNIYAIKHLLLERCFQSARTLQ